MTTLTKRLKIDPIALPIISTMQWETGESSIVGKLTCGALERDVYVAVNKALAALGGKWNRKVGGHVFDVDPRDAISALLDTGTLAVTRDGYFVTPHEIGITMARMAHLTPHCTVLEPSAGTGELAEAIRAVEPTAIITCGEKNPQRAATVRAKGFICNEWDFLQVTSDQKYQCVIQNPPFENGQDIDHVLRAYNTCLEPEGTLVSIMSEGPFFRDDRKARAFRDFLCATRHSVTELDAGAFRASGTDVKTRIVQLYKNNGILSLS